jgi:hypothetical protein
MCEINSELIELENKNKKAEDLKQKEKSTVKENEVNKQNPKRIKLDLWGFIKEQQDEPTLSNAAIELDRYLSEPVLEDQNCDIFEWWELNKHRFPTLYKLTLKYLPIPATSVPSERVFSKAGVIKDDLRNRIAPENLNAVIFKPQLNKD